MSPLKDYNRKGGTDIWIGICEPTKEPEADWCPSNDLKPVLMVSRIGCIYLNGCGKVEAVPPFFLKLGQIIFLSKKKGGYILRKGDANVKRKRD